MTIEHKFRSDRFRSKHQQTLAVDRNYRTEEVTFTMTEDNETKLSVTMTLSEARELTKGLH